MDALNKDGWGEPRLHHLALGARDPARLAAFYRDVFGLRQLAVHREAGGAVRSVWLDLGGPVLMVERTREPARMVTGVGAGPFLIALALPRDACDACERTLASRGIAVESRTEHTRYFRDPEGNRVAMSWYPVERAPADTTYL